MIVVVMGVSGSGKSTLGAELARRLQCQFLDADDYHSAANKQKMSAGIPLTDADREPWLETLHRVLVEFDERKENVVLACSALKQAYRDTLSGGLKIYWLYLKSTKEKIRERLHQRHGHFAGEALLDSQFATLEEPTNAIVVHDEGDLNTVVDKALSQLPSHGQR